MRIIAAKVLCLVVMSATIATSCLAQQRSISETVNLALSSHPQLKSKFSEYLAQDEQLKKVKSSFLPKLSIGLGVGRERSDNTTTRGLNDEEAKDLTRKESSITLSQLLFDGFKTRWQRESELEAYESIALDIQHLASDIAMQTIESHLSVAVSNQVFDYNVTNLQVHQKIADNIEARVKSGKDDYAKVHQINARLSLSLANVAAAKNNALKANSDYFRTVGVEAKTALLFDDQNLSLPKNRSDFVDDAVQYNPMILSHQKQAKSALASAKAVDKTDYPTFHIESGASWNDDIDGVEGENNDLYIMLRMRYDLYNGGANKASKAQALILSQQAEFELDDARRVIRRDAEHAWFAYQTSEERVKFLADYVELSQLTTKAYDKQFTIGQRSLIDLLDAENELLKARLQLVAARKDLSLAKYQILNLSGKLLENLSVELN